MNISHLPVLSGIGPNHSDVVETRRASLRPSETLTITSTRAEISVSQVPTNLPAIANNPSLCAPRMPSSSPCRGKTSRADFGNEPLRMREAGPGAGAAFSSADRNSVELARHPRVGQCLPSGFRSATASASTRKVVSYCPHGAMFCGNGI